MQAQRIRGTNDDDGEPLLSVGPDRITATLGFRAFNKKLVAGARGHFYAGQKRVTDIALHTPGYSVFDVFARYTLSDHAVVNVNIDNIFNRDYRKYLDQSDSLGLSVRFGLTVRLGG